MIRLFVILFLVVSVKAQFLIDPYRFDTECPECYVVNTALFDGTSDYLSRSAGNMTGITSNKTFTVSVWIKKSADGSIEQISQWFINSAANIVWQIYLLSDGRFNVQARNLANANILDAVSVETIMVADGWTHIYMCVDLTNSANRHLYISGIEDTGVVWSTYIDDYIVFSKDAATFMTPFIGNNATSDHEFSGSMAEFWFDDNYLDDVEKFYCEGNPVDLGVNGEIPTGSAPGLYLSLNGSGNSWATDSSGNGNDWTVNGNLSTTDAPCGSEALPDGMQFRWRASDLTSSPVSIWTDSIATNNMVQSTGADQPTWNSTGVIFDGASDFMTVTNWISQYTNAVLVVFQPTGSKLQKLILGSALSGGNIYLGFGDTTNFLYEGSTLGNNALGPLSSNVVDFLTSPTTNTVVYQAYTNGLSGWSDMSIPWNASGVSITRLGAGVGNGFFPGTIKEIIVWSNSTFTVSQIANIHHYCTNTYGITP